jgi:hypothetical protein
VSSPYLTLLLINQTVQVLGIFKEICQGVDNSRY